jgi:acyl carrier protein
MATRTETLNSVLTAVNKVKNTSFAPGDVNDETYLGGDLGIDSIEMLEIWFDIEKILSIPISDAEKRDKYTLGEVLDMVHGKVEGLADVQK